MLNSTATIGWLTAAHWKGHATSSPSFSKRSQIGYSYVPAGIEISIERKTTTFTNKVGLVFSVIFGHISTLAAFLRAVVSIDIDNLYSFALSFILYKLLELSKVPAVYPASVLFAYSDPFSDSFKLFKNNYSTSRNKTDYFLSNFVVNLPPKPFLLLGDLLKVSLGRRSAFGGKFFPECIISFRYCSYVSTIKKLVYFSIRSRNCCKFSKTQINSYTKICLFCLFSFFFNRDVKKELFASFVIFKICRSYLPIKILLKIFRNLNFKFLSPFNSSKRNFFSIKPDCIGAFVIADSRIFAFRTSAFKPFLFSLDCRFETFSSYNSCRNNKLGRKRAFISNGIVGEVVEFNSIVGLSFPADFTGVVVSKPVLLNCLKKYLLLVFGSFKDKLKSSLKFHICILLRYLQIFNCGLLPSLKERVSDRKERR